MKKIKKGSQWLCIKTVIMNDTDEVAYIGGKIYRSEQEDCLTDEAGQISHQWTVDYFEEYFEKVK